MQTNLATIANGASLSDAVVLNGQTLVAIAMPAAWTAATLSFQVSYDGGTTYQEMFDTAGAAISYTVGAAQFHAVDPVLWFGVHRLKVRSGTAGAAVNQGAARVINLITRMADNP